MTSSQSISLKALTEDDIQTAFEKTRSKFQIPGIRLVLITEEYYERALELYREHFLPYEPLCKALDVKWSEIIESHMLDVLKRHLSLMFVDERTNDVVAFRTIELISRDDDRIVLTPTIPLNIQDLTQYFYFCDDQTEFFDHFGINDAFRFVALVVADKYKRRGFATKIFHAAVDMIRQLGFKQLYIKGEGSSNYSQKIYEKEGFEALYENVYATWEVDGRRPLTNTGEHKSLKIYGYRVEPDELN